MELIMQPIAAQGKGEGWLEDSMKGAPGVLVEDSAQAEFGEAFVELISKHRYWNREEA
ncbi:hypothetical protein GCM10008968_34050 [Bacillus horti]